MPDIMKSSQYMTTGDFAQKVGRARQFISILVKFGEVKGVIIGNRYAIPVEEVARFQKSKYASRQRGRPRKGSFSTPLVSVSVEGKEKVERSDNNV